MDIELTKLKVDTGIAKLSTILTNFNKAPNRSYTKKFLLNQKDQSEKVYNYIIDCLVHSESKLTQSEIQFYTKGAKQKYDDIILKLNTKLVNAKDPQFSLKTIVLALTYVTKLRSKVRSKFTMAKVDLKLGHSLVDSYGGEPEKLEAFVESANLFADLVNAENSAATAEIQRAAKGTVFRFIKTRLTGSARNVIAQAETLTQLIDALKKQSGEKNTPSNILAKLKALRQTNTTESFGCEVEKLTEQLKATYINSGMPVGLATKMATDSGVDTLINGAKNQKTQLIVQAGTFSNISEAIQKMLKSDETSSNTAQIFWNVRGNHNSRGGRGTRGNMRNFYRNQNADFSSQNRNNRGSFNPRYSHQGNRRFHNNRFQNNGRGRGNGNGGHPMYYVQQMGPTQLPPNSNISPQNFVNMQIPQNPQQIFPMPQQHNQNVNNIHPLGQPFGQHTQ